MPAMKEEPNSPLAEEKLTRFIDGLESEPLHPSWVQEKAAAHQLGQLLRSHLPSRQEPPAEEFFTSQIMQRIAEEAPAPTRALAPQKLPFFERFRIWFAPLATATALLVVGGYVLHRQTPTARDSFAYTPMPNVTATLEYNDAAEATVINLEGLEAIPDTQEIKAFNVASNDAVKPGEPQAFYAANDSSKLLFVLFPSDSDGPKIHAVR
jgi:negative regulator of sigma E activity